MVISYVGQSYKRKGDATAVRRDLGALMMQLSRLEQHHKDLSSVCGTVTVVTGVLGKDGRWMEMGIIDSLPLGEL